MRQRQLNLYTFTVDVIPITFSMFSAIRRINLFIYQRRGILKSNLFMFTRAKHEVLTLRCVEAHFYFLKLFAFVDSTSFAANSGVYSKESEHSGIKDAQQLTLCIATHLNQQVLALEYDADWESQMVMIT